jgi:kynurenine formamidase
MYWVSTGQAATPVEGLPPTKFGRGDVASAVEFFGLVFHGPNVTHLDTPAHLFWKGRLYNDRPAGLITSEYGASWCPVTEMAEGIVGRGVLMDVPHAEGIDALEPGRPVTPADLEKTADAQRVTVGAGDIVLLRTGRWHPGTESGADKHALSDNPAQWHSMAGWDASCMPWLHQRDVAMVGSDVAQEVTPPPYLEFPAPVHVVGLVAMGMPLIDNCDLEALSRTCAELGRWEFQFVVAPLRIVGGSGSPVNPLAMM